MKIYACCPINMGNLQTCKGKFYHRIVHIVNQQLPYTFLSHKCILCLFDHSLNMYCMSFYLFMFYFFEV